MIINTDENHAIVAEEVFSEFYSWIEHIEPISMESAIAFCVLYKAIPLIIILTAVSKVFIIINCIVVKVY